LAVRSENVFSATRQKPLFYRHFYGAGRNPENAIWNISVKIKVSLQPQRFPAHFSDSHLALMRKRTGKPAPLRNRLVHNALQTEYFGGGAWQMVVSPDGVACYVNRMWGKEPLAMAA
jgi:hypothetical protein